MLKHIWNNVYSYCAHSGTIKTAPRCPVSASLSVVDGGIVSSPRLCKDQIFLISGGRDCDIKGNKKVTVLEDGGC